MEVIKITPRGYCHGVVDAVRILHQELEKHEGEEITLLGYLVHNEHINQEFTEKGVRLISKASRLEALDEVKEGAVVLTAHGVSELVREKAQSKGLRVVDATCSDVVRTHDLVKRLLKEGYEVVYVGRKGHPETEGVLGEGGEKIHLVQSVEEVTNLNLDSKKIAVTNQTTLSIYDNEEITKKLQEKYPQIEVYNEICNATQVRQEAAIEQAKRCDVVIVVGSRMSNNSLRLVQVVEELAHKRAYLVDNVNELQKKWFSGCNKVGVTSGASTPSQLTRAVIANIENM